jgi:hypothetical protein
MAIATYEVSPEAISLTALSIVNGLITHLKQHDLVTSDQIVEMLRAAEATAKSTADTSPHFEESARLLDQFARQESGKWINAFAVLRHKD